MQQQALNEARVCLDFTLALANNKQHSTAAEGGRVRAKTEAVQAIPLPQPAQPLRRPQGPRDGGNADERDTCGSGWIRPGCHVRGIYLWRSRCSEFNGESWLPACGTMNDFYGRRVSQQSTLPLQAPIV